MSGDAEGKRGVFPPETSTHSYTPLHNRHHPDTPISATRTRRTSTASPPPNTTHPLRNPSDLPARERAEKSDQLFKSTQSHALLLPFFFFSSHKTWVRWAQLEAARGARTGHHKILRVLKKWGIIQRAEITERRSAARSPIHTQPASAWLGSVCPYSTTDSPPAGAYHSALSWEGIRPIRSGHLNQLSID